MDNKEFGRRLSELRLQKGVSARDMSLSMGQGNSYINHIENGGNYPSMGAFFYICEYLGITPAEFFETENSNPTKIKELISEIKKLDAAQIENLTAFLKGLR